MWNLRGLKENTTAMCQIFKNNWYLTADTGRNLQYLW
jgi:hypothetical protein